MCLCMYVYVWINMAACWVIRGKVGGGIEGEVYIKGVYSHKYIIRPVDPQFI